MTDIPLERTNDDGLIDPPEKEMDIREQIAATLNAAKESPEGETADQRADRLRDASGKFVKGEKELAANVKSRQTLTLKPQADKAQVGGVATEPAQAIPAAATVKAPTAWTPAAQAKFGELPPDVQAEISRREADMHKQFTRQDEDRQFGKSVKEIAAPYEHVIAAEGGKVTDAWKLYLDTAYVMRTGTPEAKAYGIATVMRQFGVDPNALLSVLQRGNVNPSGALQHAPNQMQQPSGVQPQQVSELVQAEIQNWQIKSEVERFEATSPKFYNLLKPTMARLLTDGQAETLPEAYEKALDQTPDLRSILTADATTADAEKQRQANLAKTEAARRASGSLSGGPGAAKPNGAARPNGQSVEDDVRDAMRSAMGRV